MTVIYYKKPTIFKKITVDYLTKIAADRGGKDAYEKTKTMYSYGTTLMRGSYYGAENVSHSIICSCTIIENVHNN